MSLPATITETATETTVDADEAAILTAPEAAEAMRVHLQTVQALIRRGELRAAKVGRVYRIRRSWLDEYLDRASASACS